MINSILYNPIFSVLFSLTKMYRLLKTLNSITGKLGLGRCLLQDHVWKQFPIVKYNANMQWNTDAALKMSSIDSIDVQPSLLAT